MSLSEQQENFSSIAADLSPSLLNYLERMVGNPALAKDLLQETLMRMSKGLDGFKQNSTHKTWSYTIASRVIVDYFRSPENKIDIVDIDTAIDVADVERPLDEQMIISEMSTCVRQVIDCLPVDYRTPLILHDLEGMSTAQIAEVCVCSIATVKIRIHRARSRLKKMLEQKCVFQHDNDDGVLRCDRK